MKVRLNKIASATRNAKLPRDVTLSDTVVAEEGSVVAVRALDRKQVYNEIEDVHGGHSRQEHFGRADLHRIWVRGVTGPFAQGPALQAVGTAGVESAAIRCKLHFGGSVQAAPRHDAGAGRVPQQPGVGVRGHQPAARGMDVDDF